MPTMRKKTRLNDARAIFQSAVQAANPSEAIRSFVLGEKSRKILADPKFKNILITGCGKASVQMAAATVRALGEISEKDLPERKLEGFVVTKYGHGDDPCRKLLKENGIVISEAGHPIPDQAGVLATKRLLEVAEKAKEDTLVFNLISGGGSAVTCLPFEQISLQDLQVTVSVLLNCGANINDLNCIRKHLTQFQGGRFASKLYPATVVSLLVSDVIGDSLDTIAGGPTSADRSTFQDALEIIKDFDLKGKLPPAVVAFLEAESKEESNLHESIKEGNELLSKTSNHIVGSNSQALAAAKVCAESLGYKVLLLSSRIEGEAREVAKVINSIAKEIEMNSNEATCLLMGGEATVTLCTNHGLGGRNQEMALSMAVQLATETNDKIVFLAGGTDGQDGPCDAAGAIVSGMTCGEERSKLSKAKEFLSRNDSYHFFQKVAPDCHLKIGPTGTNVADVYLALIN